MIKHLKALIKWPFKAVFLLGVILVALGFAFLD